MNKEQIIAKVNEMTDEQISKQLNPTEYLVASNPVVSSDFKDAIRRGCVEPDLVNYGARIYYTDSLADQLVHEPESYGLDNLEISDDLITEILMLEKAYGMLMFVDL